jgi:hypothetical protein
MVVSVLASSIHGHSPNPLCQPRHRISDERRVVEQGRCRAARPASAVVHRRPPHQQSGAVRGASCTLQSDGAFAASRLSVERNGDGRRGLTDVCSTASPRRGLDRYAPGATACGSEMWTALR